MQSVEFEGFVLAGGRSSRFGSDKALAEENGKPLVVHALDALRSFGVTPRIVARRYAPYQSLAKAFVLSERDALGPGEGLRAALSACSVPWAIVLSADMPEVGVDMIQVLLDVAGGGEVEAAQWESGERLHPFPGAYHRSILRAWNTGDAGVPVQRTLDQVNCRRLLAADHGFPVGRFRNVNRVEDLRAK